MNATIFSTLDEAVAAADAYISGLIGACAERYNAQNTIEGVRIYEHALGQDGYVLRPVDYGAPPDLHDEALGRWVGLVDLFSHYAPRRGGYRPGAGRKPLGEEPMERRTVTLPAAMIARLEQIGNGNLSAGIRRLANEQR